MLTREGPNGQGQTFWKLHVPDEHCAPGLEVGVIATADGLMVGGDVIPWNEIEVAKLRALGRL